MHRCDTAPSHLCGRLCSQAEHASLSEAVATKEGKDAVRAAEAATRTMEVALRELGMSMLLLETGVLDVAEAEEVQARARDLTPPAHSVPLFPRACAPRRLTLSSQPRITHAILCTPSVHLVCSPDLCSQARITHVTTTLHELRTELTRLRKLPAAGAAMLPTLPLAPGAGGPQMAATLTPRTHVLTLETGVLPTTLPAGHSSMLELPQGGGAPTLHGAAPLHMVHAAAVMPTTA